MSIFGEFRVTAGTFALKSTLAALPETVIEIDRVVASEEVLTPYFWVSEVPFDSFENAAEDDDSIRNLQQLDTFEDAETALYRAEWSDPVEALVYAYTQAGAIILEAIGQDGEWELRIRFDNPEALELFQEHCRNHDVEFDLERLYRTSQPRTGGQYGLTEKQQEALVTARKAGYFEPSGDTSLEDVARELGITQQSLSDRLRRGYDTLIANTLLVTSPPSLGEDG